MNKKLCIIVPYRDREQHLKQFLPHIHNTLLEQKIEHDILIVEQTFNKSFNRGKLLNIGFDSTLEKYDYYCFHDIDMLPLESDYSYYPGPVHLAVEVEQFGYKLPYLTYFGGVTLFDKESFKKINGFSNEYWGWGGEDDDLYERCLICNIKPYRRKGRFKSLEHERPINKEEYNKNLENLMNLRRYKDYKSSGLNTLKYTIISESDKIFEGVQYKQIIVEI